MVKMPKFYYTSILAAVSLGLWLFYTFKEDCKLCFWFVLNLAILIIIREKLH